MSDFEQPDEKNNVTVRPLAKGMDLRESGQHLEDGKFVRVRNARVTTRGVTRRPAFYTTAQADEFRDHAMDTRSYTRTDGSVLELFWSESFVYNVSKANGLTLIPYTYTTGTVATADGVTITGTSTAWSSTTDWHNVMAGDWFVLDSDGTAVRIAEVVSATSLVLDTAYPDTSFTGEAYTVYRGFRARDRRKAMVDSVNANNRMVFLSEMLPPVEINNVGNALEPLQAAGGDMQINSAYMTARTGAYFNERLYLGYITELVGGAYVTYKQRLRASSPTDMGNFEGAGATYIDLDYARGELMRVLPMGDLLVVYFEDSIYLGQSTPDVTMPLVFNQVEMGGIGLVGSKAVAPYLDGHFFVGQNNIFYLSTRGPEAIGDAVISETIAKCQEKWRIYAVHDAKRSRICFGFPEGGTQIVKVWSFDYRTQAWSYEDYNTWMISSMLFDDSLSWDELTGSWDTMATYGPTWADLQYESDAELELMREFQGVLQIASHGASEDDIAGPVEMELISKDHDLQYPEWEKCWTRLSIKLDYPGEIAFTQAVDFQVQVSHNRGRTWKDVGRLRIRAGMDEGHCDYRLTSSHIRFRLRTSAVVTPFSVAEYSLNVTPFAGESHLGSQQGRNT